MKFTAYAATMQSVWFSRDEGQSWARPLTPTCGIYNESRCWGVSTHQDRPGEVLSGTDQGLYRWSPSEQRWNYIPSPMDDLQIMQVAQSPDDPDFIVCGTRPAEMFISENGGLSWTRGKLNSATECWFINTPRVTSIQFDPLDSDTIWTTIEIDGVFRSSDRGKTWERLSEGLLDNDTHNLVFLDRNETRRILCSTEAGLHQSDDDGQSWTHVPIPEAPWPYFRAIETRADNNGVLFASVGDKPSGEIGVLLVSHDYGESWKKAPVPEPVNSTIWWIATNPADPNLVFIATIFGQIFRSQDGGESWEKMPRELGEIRMIAWAPSADG